MFFFLNIHFRHEHLNNYIKYKYIHLKKQYEIVKLKMNVGISDAFVCFTNNEINRILGLCEHVNDLTKQLREKSDFEAINQEKILVEIFF